MKTDRTANAFELRAAQAITSLLGQVSGVKLRTIQREPSAGGRGAEILVQLDVLGRGHTLACEVSRDPRPCRVRACLKKLQHLAEQREGIITPVLIAPHLSPRAQAICKQNHAGFLDLDGNARLTLGEVFIGKRSLHQQSAA